MTKAELEVLAAKHGLTVDPGHAGTGKFRDLEIGCGALFETLIRFMHDLQAAGVPYHFRTVNVKEHHQHGQSYVEVPSFWYE